MHLYSDYASWDDAGYVNWIFFNPKLGEEAGQLASGAEVTERKLFKKT